MEPPARPVRKSSSLTIGSAAQIKAAILAAVPRNPGGITFVKLNNC